MKEKIFEKMRENGWHLGDDTDKNWNDVYSIHYDFIDDLYYKFVEEDSEMEFTLDLNDIDKQSLRDFTEFIGDFLRAINELEKEEN